MEMRLFGAIVLGRSTHIHNERKCSANETSFFVDENKTGRDMENNTYKNSMGFTEWNRAKLQLFGSNGFWHFDKFFLEPYINNWTNGKTKAKPHWLRTDLWEIDMFYLCVKTLEVYPGNNNKVPLHCDKINWTFPIRPPNIIYSMGNCRGWKNRSEMSVIWTHFICNLNLFCFYFQLTCNTRSKGIYLCAKLKSLLTSTNLNWLKRFDVEFYRFTQIKWIKFFFFFQKKKHWIITGNLLIKRKHEIYRWRSTCKWYSGRLNSALQ